MALLLTVVRKIPMINAQVHKGTSKMRRRAEISRFAAHARAHQLRRIPQLVVPKATSFG